MCRPCLRCLQSIAMETPGKFWDVRHLHLYLKEIPLAAVWQVDYREARTDVGKITVEM